MATRTFKRKTLINKLDKVVSQIVRARGKCEYCGKVLPPSKLNAHHFYSRSLRSVRWDLDNLFCLCPLHHTFSSKFSAHLTPAYFVEWAKMTRGKEWYDRLWVKASTPKQYSDKELIELYERLKKL